MLNASSSHLPAADPKRPAPAPHSFSHTNRRRVLTKLQQSNTAARKELDWVGQTAALSDARRLVAHHPDALTPAALHDLVTAATPAIDQLRSCTARGAMQLFGEMFAALGARCDRELDEIVPLLIKKAGEVSTAGRDNFLGQEADRALASMTHSCSEHRALAALLGSTGARATAARAKVAAHLDALLEGGRCRLVFALGKGVALVWVGGWGALGGLLHFAFDCLWSFCAT